MVKISKLAMLTLKIIILTVLFTASIKHLIKKTQMCFVDVSQVLFTVTLSSRLGHLYIPI